MSSKRKVCTGCNRKRALKFYYRDKRSKDGHKSRCKDCCRASQQERRHRAAQKEKSLAFSSQEPTSVPTAQEIRAEAHRNALLHLMRRHDEEFRLLLRQELWKLQGGAALRELGEQERWVSVV